MFDRGTTVVLADLRVNPLDPFQGHKTLNYWPRLRELQVAAGKRAGELPWSFQVTNHLAGGCVSNAFVVRGGRMFTPIARGEEQEVADGPSETMGEGLEDEPRGSSGGAVMPSPVLPGVVRRWVMDWAVAEGIEVERRMLSIDDVLTADEVFLTNSSWGVLPVVERRSGKRWGMGRSGRFRGGWWGRGRNLYSRHDRNRVGPVLTVGLAL